MSHREKQHKIGPTGKYPAGKPYFIGDVGGIDSKFEIVRPNCEWSFGTPLDHIVLTPDNAKIVMDTFRAMIRRHLGDVKPDNDKLRDSRIFVCAAMDGTVRVDFILAPSAPFTTFKAKPGIFLAIADQIEHELAKLAKGVFVVG